VPSCCPPRVGIIKANDARWVQTLKVYTNSEYRLSGCIKTDNVAHNLDSVDAGANLSLLGGWTRSTGVMGTNDWTCVDLQFNTGGDNQITAAARLGMYVGTTTGTAWFDDLRLEQLSAPPVSGTSNKVYLPLIVSR
jgi:hypothetical protein